MTSDHWRTRVKGGVVREFLRYAGRVIGWIVTVGSGPLTSDFLAARREQTAKRHYILYGVHPARFLTT